MQYAPAIVALVQNHGGQPTGLHATFITPDGSRKAFADRSRVMFGEVMGGAVRLSGGAKGGDLGVAEGIETALSFGLLNAIPCWAALSTAGLKAFRPPAALDRLIIGADGDQTGREAAFHLAKEASARCEAVVIAAPEGRDWNDVLRGTA